MTWGNIGAAAASAVIGSMSGGGGFGQPAPTPQLGGQGLPKLGDGPTQGTSHSSMELLAGNRFPQHTMQHILASRNGSIVPQSPGYGLGQTPTQQSPGVNLNDIFGVEGEPPHPVLDIASQSLKQSSLDDIDDGKSESKPNFLESIFGNLDANLQRPSMGLGLGLLNQISPIAPYAGLLAMGLLDPKKLGGR